MDGADDTIDSAVQAQRIVWRLLLCGQWPSGAEELYGFEGHECTAYTFPYHPKLRVRYIDGVTWEQTDQDAMLAGEPVAPDWISYDSPRVRYMQGSIMKPHPSWKKVVRVAARFCAVYFDKVSAAVQAGRGVPQGKLQKEAVKAAKYVAAAVTGCAPPTAPEGGHDSGGDAAGGAAAS